MSAKLNPVPIPKAVRQLLSRAWLDIDSETLWLYHRQWDRHGGQSYYYCPEELSGIDGFDNYTADEVRALVKARAVPGSLAIDRPGKSSLALNQHASHSLQQFLYECGAAYARHLERMRRWETSCDESQLIAARNEASSA